MGTLNKGSFLAAAAAMMGIGALPALKFGAPPLPMDYTGSRSRSRTPGKPRPAGAKLARQAEKRRIGIAVLR